MKRLVFVLSGLLVLPAFAEVAPIYYDDAMEFADAEIVADDDAVVAEESEVTAVAAPVVQPSRVNPRSGAIAGGRVASRVVPSVTSGQNQRVAAGRVTATSRATKNAVQARTATPRSATRSVRSATGAANQIATTRREMQTNGNVAARASIVQTDTVNTPLYTGRVSTRTSGAIRARIPTITSTSGTTSVSVAETKAADAASSMDELAQLTDFCKAQYTSCMDNFCNVLDDNQGRCSCSKNIKNYAKTEEALKEATEALKDVAQQIQYIGLTSDEVETLFSQTEAELAMNSASDNSQIKNDLDKIKNLIVDVKSGTASSTDTGLSFDLSGLLDFSIDSTGFDLSALFGNQTNTSSISNQRGEQLYKTASTRCKAAVLTDCQKQGVDISVITNSYDLEIDKQCIAYERQLTDTNDEMSQTVRNAKSVLQRARLLVAQQKNAYDLRGCINALDACMQDDYVCGTDYEYCLDPTGKYIINGEVVIGSTPGYVLSSAATTAPSAEYAKDTLYGTWYYDEKNPWGATNGTTTTTDGTLSEYINQTVKTAVKEPSAKMSEYLQYKIGYNDGTKNHGMCISVLNKCQDLTYDNGKYNPANNVVKQYLERTMVQIKSQQDTIIAEHAENCISDVSSCLSSNNFDVNNKSKANIAVNACRAQIKTCMSVNGDSSQVPDPEEMLGWVGSLFGCDDENSYFNTSTNKCVTCNEGEIWNYEANQCEAGDA